jgi:tetratricopeptide (TPR) repeat protein
VPEILSAVPDHAINVLALGCDTGLLSGELKKANGLRKVTEIDLNRAGVGIDIEQFDPPFKPGEFDCILFAGLLERLVDPWAFAKRYTAFLKPDGALVVSVPNIRHLGALSALVERGEWVYREDGVLQHAQLRFFTKKAILRLMDEIGVRVDSVRYLGAWMPSPSPHVWEQRTVVFGHLSLKNVSDDDAAELSASRLLFTGRYQPLDVLPAALSRDGGRDHAGALQTDGDSLGEQSIPALERMLATHPDHALAHNDLGVLRYQLQEKGKALFHYEKAVEIDPGNVRFAKNLADFYFVEMGRIEASQKMYCGILKENPHDLEVIAALLSTCLANRQMLAAGALCTKLLDLAPDHAGARKFLETLNGHADPSSEGPAPEQMHQEAAVLADAGMAHAAIAVLETVCREHPGFAVAHNDLGVMYTQVDDLTRAREHYEKAVALNPGNAVFLKNLGDFYLAKMGMVENFIKRYLDALQLAPRDVDALVMLGNVYAALNLPAEANSFYRRAAAIEPENEHARQGLERLRHVH